MIKMLLAIVLLTLVSAQAQIPPPKSDSQCLSDWTMVYHAEDTIFCDDFCLWTCPIVYWNESQQAWYPTIKFASTCYVTSSMRSNSYTVTLPFVRR